MLAVSEKVRIFAPVKQKGRVAQLNRVADYGSAGYRFESCRDHEKEVCQNAHLLFYAQSPDFHKLGLCYYLKNLYL